MKKAMLIITVLMLVFSVSAMAKVRINIAGHSTSSDSYLGDRGLGIGVEFGYETGLSLKTWLDRTNALQFDGTWSLGYGFGVGASYLIHNFDIITGVEGVKIPLYFGIKGWASLWDNAVAVGIQVPLGIDFIFKEAPIDVFVELDPGIVVVPGIYQGFGGGVGIRYWLK